MEEKKEMFGKAVFFFIVGVTLAALFVWTMVQGITLHLAGDSTVSLAYYFVAWISGVGGITLYWQAKNLFHYAKISG